MTGTLPSGDRPWFERRGSRWCYQVMPVSFQGWALIFLYVLVAIAVSVIFLREEEQTRLIDWIAWAGLLGAASLLFFVTMFRMSAPASGRNGRSRRRSNGNHAGRRREE